MDHDIFLGIHAFDKQGQYSIIEKFGLTKFVFFIIYLLLICHLFFYIFQFCEVTNGSNG